MSDNELNELLKNVIVNLKEANVNFKECIESVKECTCAIKWLSADVKASVGIRSGEFVPDPVIRLSEVEINSRVVGGA